MCLVTPISIGACPKGRAGISVMWATACEHVTDLTFDADRQITAITMDAANADATFKKIEFEKNTAFFTQEKTRVKSNVNVAQTISFIEPLMTNTNRNALEDLNDCCCLHAIVKDNIGNYHYAGISFNATTDEWESEDLKTGDGSGNTGADPTADSNEFLETLTANASFYAPYFAGGEAGIPVA